MKKLLSIFAIFLILLLLPLSVTAHSGRTDSHGGHNDNINGGYHYHHGYSAHQHPDGECPYKTYSTNSTSSTSDTTQNIKSPYKKYNYMYISPYSHAKNGFEYGIYIPFALAFFGLFCFFPGKLIEKTNLNLNWQYFLRAIISISLVVFLLFFPLTVFLLQSLGYFLFAFCVWGPLIFDKLETKGRIIMFLATVLISLVITYFLPLSAWMVK